MNSKEISVLISQGRAYNSSSFLLRTLEDGLESGLNIKSKKVAYIVSKKIFKTAVSRNKAKRRLRNTFMQTIASYGGQKGQYKNLNFVFTAKKSLEKIEFAALVTEMKSVFAKVV